MGPNSLAIAKGIGRADAETVDGVRAVKHEVLNALTPVVAYAKDLAKDEENPKRRAQLHAIERAGLAIERMVRAIGRGKNIFEPNFKLVSVARLLREASEEALAFANQRGITLRVVHDSSSSRKVIADPELIRRLLVNLLFNALEATPDGRSVLLDSRHVPEGIKLSVRDQGPGFEFDNLDGLPEGFSSKGDGHGTGLSVCKTIAMLHGSILRSRNLNPGAEVFFVLPQITSGPQVRLSQNKPHLLVVDDDPNVADSISNLLSERFSIDVAYDAAGSISILRRGGVDAMVVDMDLGRATGQELLHEIDQLGIAKPQCVVFVTGDPAAKDGDMVQGVRVLTKPFDSQSLIRMLEYSKPQRFSWIPAWTGSAVVMPCSACA